MNTYSFRINAVDAKVSKDGLSNVIERVHYTHIATNPDGVQVSRNDVVMLPAPQPEVFVPADQLVQADIIEWIKPLIDEEAQQAGLDSHMAEKVAPTIVRLSIPETLEPEVEEVAEEPSSEESTDA
jgi:hypothetical protein